MDGAKAVQHLVANGVPGALVECGVYDGRQQVEWCDALLKLGISDREIWMYDTFAGLVAPSEHDRTTDGAALYTMSAEQVRSEWERQADKTSSGSAWCLCPLDKVRANVAGTGYPPGMIRCVVGDVRETLSDPAIPLPERIALLRLDTDWYESTRAELDALYDRLVPGGVLVLDDYS